MAMLLPSAFIAGCMGAHVTVPSISGIASIKLHVGDEYQQTIDIRDRRRVEQIIELLNARRSLWFYYYDSIGYSLFATPLELELYDRRKQSVLSVDIGAGGMTRWLDPKHPDIRTLLFLDRSDSDAESDLRDLCRIVGGEFEKGPCPRLLDTHVTAFT